MATLKNARHELFCRGIVEGKTGDQAFIDAGYRPNRKNAARLKAKEVIQRRIKELQKRGLSRHDITVDRVLGEYARLAFADIRQLYDEDGHLKPIHELPDDIAAALAGVDIVTVNKGYGEVEYIAKVKLTSKLPALSDLGKHLKIFADEPTAPVNVNITTVSDLELARRVAYMLKKGTDALPD